MRNHRKFQVFIPLLLSLAMILGIFFGFRLRETYRVGTGFQVVPEGSSTLDEVRNLIRARYMDSLRNSSLTNSGIRGLLNHLDPHSIYIPPSELQQVNDDLDGDFSGIGVEYILYRDTINVVRALVQGPSLKAGIRMGDKIIRINDSLAAGVHISTGRIQKLLRGPEGSPVEVQILRGNTPMDFRIIRGSIPLYSLEASYMIGNGIGYIRIARFSATTYKEFMKAMDRLGKQGLKKLILDLRGNPGGYLEDAIDVAEEFLGPKKLLLFTKGIHAPRVNYYSQRPGFYQKDPLAILVNEESASASEIVSGTMQDWDRAVIIGRRTFGKGLVQEQYPLQNGGALRLTIARYYLPSGRCIQKPYTDGLAAYDEDLMNRLHDGELLHRDSIHITDSTPFKTLLKGRTVYGGEGIIPDYFIPYDTAEFNPVITRLYSDNLFGEFAYVYYEQYPELFKGYSGSLDFSLHFRVSTDLIRQFIRFAAPDSQLIFNQLDPAQLQIIRSQIKAFLARQIWQDEGYFQALNASDPAVQKAVRILQLSPAS